MKFDLSINNPSRVFIKSSNIEKSGFGAFANQFISKGAVIGEYIGKIIDPKLFDQKRSHTDYGFSVRDGSKVLFVIDAANKKHGNWTRYINCARNRSEENVKFFQYKKRIFVKTLIDIKPGAELLVWYGFEYGEKLLGYNIYN
ncbi:MAG: SET domain-containing protein-lysine N-methyltransferase [Candidatus Absconditabacteria bacterium]